MNNRNTRIVRKFNDPNNIQKLKNVLIARFPQYRGLIAESIYNLIADYSDLMADQLGRSDPLGYHKPPGVSDSWMISEDQELHEFNKKFIENRVKFFEQYSAQKCMDYTVTDGYPTSTEPQYNKPLKHWLRNTGAVSSLGIRGDPGVDSDQKRQKGIITGINFCDNTHMGENQYMDQLFDETFYEYNKGQLDKGTNDNIMSTNRLINKIEKNHDRTYGEIPFYEKALYSRPYDRHIDGTLGDTQYGYKNYGYNMSDLRCSTHSKLQ
ncbi:MAG: hypothetical protein ACYCPT_03880 [Acidimicrobiales bacterium]